MSGLGTVAAWTSPLLFAAVAARVFAGGVEAPLLVLLVVVAPLLGLLRRADALPASAGQTLLALPGLALVLGAHLLAFVDLARLNGIERAPALGVALLLALIPIVRGGLARRWSGVMAALGVAAVTAPLLALGVAAGSTPWSAWGQVASRPALVFAERSGWVTEGRRLVERATLVFAEPHRVTAIAPATLYVFEAETSGAEPRERRLAGGDALTLRSGDRLAVEAGARLRFERGKRVPVALASGVAWADPRERSGLPALVPLIGLALTLAGGALALVPPAQVVSRRMALGVPMALLVLALAAACTGVYAMYLAPDLAIGASLSTALVELPRVATDPARAPALAALTGIGLLALFLATACALRERLAEVVAVVASAAPRRSPALDAGAWVLLCGVALLLTLWPADPWRVLLTGLGLLASTWSAPALARGDARATLAGALVGGAAFVLCALLSRGPSAPAALVAYPALVAAPLGWATAFVLRARSLRVAGRTGR